MSAAADRFILDRYADLLPVTERTPRVTLGEGGTPLVRSRALERELGLGALYFKLELANPTGSFKDRGMVLAAAKAVEDGAEAVICASTGNTSASMAAYAARHGLRACVIVPANRVATGKLAQAVAHGAEIVTVDGSFDDALRVARALADAHPVVLLNSVNPHRIQGQTGVQKRAEEHVPAGATDGLDECRFHSRELAAPTLSTSLRLPERRPLRSRETHR